MACFLPLKPESELLEKKQTRSGAEAAFIKKQDLEEQPKMCGSCTRSMKNKKKHKKIENLLLFFKGRRIKKPIR